MGHWRQLSTRQGGKLWMRLPRDFFMASNELEQTASSVVCNTTKEMFFEGIVVYVNVIISRSSQKQPQISQKLHAQIKTANKKKSWTFCKPQIAFYYNLKSTGNGCRPLPWRSWVQPPIMGVSASWHGKSLLAWLESFKKIIALCQLVGIVQHEMINYFVEWIIRCIVKWTCERWNVYFVKKVF